MKKFVLAASVIFVITLLTISMGIAEPTHPNEVGLYLNEDGTGETISFVVGTPEDVYLVLTKPADVENGDVPYTSIRAFECSLNFNPIPDDDLFLTYADFPVPAVDIGPRKDINAGVIDFIVGYGSPNPVTNESVILVTLTFLNFNTGLTEVTMSPFNRPSIPDQMVFEALPGQLRAMYPISGSHDAPVFIFNGEAVAVETESFGSVKALYR